MVSPLGNYRYRPSLSGWRPSNAIARGSRKGRGQVAAGDAKLAGRLIAAGATKGTPGSAFVLDIDIVSLVQVDGDELLFTIWRPGGGLSTTRRS